MYLNNIQLKSRLSVFISALAPIEVIITLGVFLFGATSPAVFAVTIFSENFNSLWSTTNPPSGWTITFSGDTSTNDWHRKDANEDPWAGNNTPYACLIGNQITGDAPDSLISPIIDCSNYYNVILRCSTYFIPFTGAYRAILRGSVDGGLSWPILVRDYTNQIVPPQLEIFDLTWAWNQPLVRFAWIFEGFQAGLSHWSLDNVSLIGSTINDTDIATIRINRPKRFEKPSPPDVTPLVQFMNVGRDTQYNVPVYIEIRALPDSTIVYTAADMIDTFPAGASIVKTFSLAWTADTGEYIATAWCDAAGDQERMNDTLREIVKVSLNEEQKFDDNVRVRDSSFVWERYGWGVKFEPSFYPALVESVKFHFAVSDTISNRFRVRICGDDRTGAPGKPLYESKILTAVSGWNSYDLLLDSIVVWDSIYYLFFIQVEGSPLSPKLSRDAARDSNASYWVCYDTSYIQDFTPGDWMIRCVLNYQFETPRPNPNDFRTVFISYPEEGVVVRPPSRTFIPKARVENWGDNPQSNVPVVCSIISITNPAIMPYVSTRWVDLNPGADTFLSFDAWVPEFRGEGRVTVRTRLQADMDPSNDAKEETISVYRSYFTGQDFSPFDYRWIDSDTTGGPIYSWIDTSQNLGVSYNRYQGDDQTWFIPLSDTLVGFPFRFYDSTYRSLWVSDNGWIRIGPDTGLAPPGYPVNTSLPNSMMPNNTIYAFWDDLIFDRSAGDGGIYFKKVGRAPNRKFVVIYQDVRRKYAPSSDRLTFEVIFAENGTITIQYQDVFCSDARYNYGRSATVGLENQDGSIGLMYLYGEARTGGRYPGNKLNPGLAIQFYPYKKDVALFRKVAPPRYTLPGNLTPTFRVINYGNTVITEPFWTKLRIRNFATIYDDSVQTNLTLQPGDSITLNFAPVVLDLGKYSLTCTVAFLTGEKETLNNIIVDSIFVQAWTQKTDIPLGRSRKKVKDGALAYYPAGKKIFALKGGNDLEFFQYDIMTEKWETLPPLPDSNAQTGKRRKAKTGTALCFGGNELFAVKGGNTQDFYSYNVISNTWTERCTIPFIFTGHYGSVKKPHYGAALVYAPINNQVYLLSGNKTRQFLSYNPVTNIWRIADSIPGYYTRLRTDYRERKVRAGGALAGAGFGRRPHRRLGHRRHPSRPPRGHRDSPPHGRNLRGAHQQQRPRQLLRADRQAPRRRRRLDRGGVSLGDFRRRRGADRGLLGRGPERLAPLGPDPGARVRPAAGRDRRWRRASGR